ADCSLDLLVGEGTFADFLIRSADRNHDVAAVLAIDLDRDFDLVFFGQVRIELRPGLAQQDAPIAEHLPQLCRDVRGEWSDEQNDRAQRVCYLLSRDRAAGDLLAGSI